MSPDWVQVIINITFIIIYSSMLISSNKMATETKDMKKETIITRKQAYRPEVIAYIREENDFLYFRVQNVGSRPAFNIHIQIENFFYNTEIESVSNEHEIFFKQIQNTTRDVEKDIYLLAPNQYIETYMGLREFIVNRNSNVERNVKVTYFNYEEELYIEEYTLSTNDFTKKSYFKKDSLEKISRELERISTIMDKSKDLSDD